MHIKIFTAEVFLNWFGFFLFYIFVCLLLLVLFLLIWFLFCFGFFFREDSNMLIFPLIKFLTSFVRLVLEISYYPSLMFLSSLYTYVNLKKASCLFNWLRSSSNLCILWVSSYIWMTQICKDCLERKTADMYPCMHVHNCYVCRKKKKRFINVYWYSYIILSWFSFLQVLIRVLWFVLNRVEIAEIRELAF